MLSAAQLIAIMLAVNVLELLAMLASAVLGKRRALMRQMAPGATAGLFLSLALHDVQVGGSWLPLWVVGAGAAHALDWVQRARH